MRRFYERPASNDPLAPIRACYRHCFPMLVHLPNGFALHVFDKARFIVLQNARDFVHVLGELGNTVVLHGHRPIGYEGRIDGKTDVMSARSSTLGDAQRGEKTPGFQQIVVERVVPSGTRVVSATAWSHDPGMSVATKREQVADSV